MTSNTAGLRSPSVQAHTGAFVQTSDLGTGRLIGVDGDTALVQYFKAPGRSPYVDREHPLQHVSPVTLSAHTRVYFHDGKRWHIGRIDGVHPGDPRKYLIALPNGKGAQLPVESFDVRWAIAISDPYEVLETVGGDSPIVYETRLNMLRAWYSQRAAMTNVEGLVLGSVELHRHQLDVVRRVGADPIKRYLLADEVGLGKTIEASALIWQFLKETPDGRVLILAPDHLREQWQDELLDRFRTDHFSKAWIRIRSHDAVSTWPDQGVGLLVIDEAHHVTRTGTLPHAARQRLAELARSAGSLLLLSATPVRSNEAGFLDLLCLIDPDHYRPDDLDDFARRVELRDRLALTYQALTPDLDEFDLSLYADELNKLFPDDMRLHELLAGATSADGSTRPSTVERVREYISETYRLHHRLLRTRRTVELGTTFAVRGRRRGIPFTLEVDDNTDTLRRELLDSVRVHLTAAIESHAATKQDATKVFREISQRCGSLSHALLPLLASAEADSNGSQIQSFHRLAMEGILPDWTHLVEEIHAGHQSVVNSLGEALSNVAVSHGHRKTILASAFTETAEVIAADMTKRWGSDRIATHLLNRSRAENVSQLHRWGSEEGPCTLLICDAGAEEGINLQPAELLIHLDLPWESFRVEQRIGRCDRHADRDAGPIPSIVAVYGDQPYARAWIEYLADGCDIFDRSVSSLQYVLADTEQILQARVLSGGPQSLVDATAGQAERLNTELITIVAHDALDSIQKPAWAGDESADEALLASDAQPGLTKSLLSWFQSVGAQVRNTGSGTVRIDRKPRPQIPFGLEYELTPYMDTPLALERSSAVSRLVPILRAGHPLVEAVAAHLRDSDRGVAFALCRHAPGQWPPVPVLRTDFLVAPATSSQFVAQASELGMADWARQLVEEVMPPVLETVLMTIDGKEVSVASLRRPYDKRVDQNLASRPELFERLSAHLDWSSVCSMALARSRILVNERESITERPQLAASILLSRIRQRSDLEEARRTAGIPDAGLDLSRLQSLVPGQLEAEARVLGCGVIFVGDQKRIL